MNKGDNGEKRRLVWLVLGDIHASPVHIEKIPELQQADAILVSGDMTNCGDPEQAKKVLESFTAAAIPVFAQMGNMDLPSVNDWLEERNINLHCAMRELSPNTAVFGVGGSTPTPMDTPTEFPESSYATWLEEEWQKAKDYPRKILISHNPPKDTLCDDIGGHTHVGSSAVRAFIEKYQPDICVCGHIHEARGVDKIGDTIIINPGPFAEGGYVKIVEEDGKLQASLETIGA